MSVLCYCYLAALNCSNELGFNSSVNGVLVVHICVIDIFVIICTYNVNDDHKPINLRCQSLFALIEVHYLKKYFHSYKLASVYLQTSLFVYASTALWCLIDGALIKKKPISTSPNVRNRTSVHLPSVLLRLRLKRLTFMRKLKQQQNSETQSLINANLRVNISSGISMTYFTNRTKGKHDDSFIDHFIGSGFFNFVVSVLFAVRTI